MSLRDSKSGIQPHLMHYYLTPESDPQSEEKIADINALYQTAQELTERGEATLPDPGQAEVPRRHDCRHGIAGLRMDGS